MKKFTELSNDITVLAKNDKGELEPIDGEIDILQVTGVVTDPDEIKDIEDSVKENFTLDTSLVVKDIKRGEIIWLTALLQKSSSTAWNSQKLGVIKCRIVDYYYGLNKLQDIKNK